MGPRSSWGLTWLDEHWLIRLFLHAVELEAACRLYIFKQINVWGLSVLKAGGCVKGNESVRHYGVHS